MALLATGISSGVTISSTFCNESPPIAYADSQKVSIEIDNAKVTRAYGSHSDGELNKNGVDFIKVPHLTTYGSNGSTVFGGGNDVYIKKSDLNKKAGKSVTPKTLYYLLGSVDIDPYSEGEASTVLIYYEIGNGKVNYDGQNGFWGASNSAVKVSDLLISLRGNGEAAAGQQVPMTSDLSLGDRPIVGNLLAEVFYTEMSSNGDSFKKSDIGYSTIASYPSATTSVEQKDNLPSSFTYYPNNLRKSKQSTNEGQTLANILNLYANAGWLTVSKSATSSATTTSDGSDGLFDTALISSGIGVGFFSGSLGTLLILAGVTSFLLQSLLTGVLDLFRNVIDAVGYIAIHLSPGQMFGALIGAVPYQGINQNGVTAAFDHLFNLTLGSNNKEAITRFFNSIRGLVVAIWTGGALLLTLISLHKSRVGEIFGHLRKWFFRITVPFAFFMFLYPAYNNAINPTPDGNQGQGPTNKQADSDRVDVLKLAIASNMDPAYIYSDTEAYKLLIASKDYDTNKFQLSLEQVKALNQKIEATLGSELSTAIGYGSGSDIAEDTFNVNDYIQGIQTAAGLNVGVAANDLPEPLTWDTGDDSAVYKVSTIAPIRDKKWRYWDFTGTNNIKFRGMPVLFTDIPDNEQMPSNDSEDSGTQGGVSYRNIGRVYHSVKYDSSIWNSTTISNRNAGTYLYGASQNPTAVQAKPSTYNGGSNGNSMVKDLTKPYNATGTSSDEKTPEQKVKDPTSATTTKSDKDNKDLGAGGDDTRYWQAVNSYMIALYNKYAGLKTRKQTGNNYQFSNQSMIFLLQSNLQSDKLSFFGTNTSYTTTQKGNSSSTSDFRYYRFINPQPSDDKATAIVQNFFGNLAIAILYGGLMVSMSKMSLTEFVGGWWKSFYNIIVKSSLTAGVAYLLVDITFRVLFIWLPRGVDLSNEWLSTASNYLLENTGLWSITLGVFQALVAFFLVKPMIKWTLFGKNTRVSVLEIVVFGLVFMKDALMQPLNRLDEFVYATPNSDNYVEQGDPNGNAGAIKMMRNLAMLNYLDRTINPVANVANGAGSASRTLGLENEGQPGAGTGSQTNFTEDGGAAPFVPLNQKIANSKIGQTMSGLSNARGLTGKAGFVVGGALGAFTTVAEKGVRSMVNKLGSSIGNASIDFDDGQSGGSGNSSMSTVANIGSGLIGEQISGVQSDNGTVSKTSRMGENGLFGTESENSFGGGEPVISSETPSFEQPTPERAPITSEPSPNHEQPVVNERPIPEDVLQPSSTDSRTEGLNE